MCSQTCDINRCAGAKQPNKDTHKIKLYITQSYKNWELAWGTFWDAFGTGRWAGVHFARAAMCSPPWRRRWGAQTRAGRCSTCHGRGAQSTAPVCVCVCVCVCMCVCVLHVGLYVYVCVCARVRLCVLGDVGRCSTSHGRGAQSTAPVCVCVCVSECVCVCCT